MLPISVLTGHRADYKYKFTEAVKNIKTITFFLNFFTLPDGDPSGSKCLHVAYRYITLVHVYLCLTVI